MIYRRTANQLAGFTLVEILVGIGVFTILMSGLLVAWTTLQRMAINVTAYTERQNDQIRILDYLKRDIRRASTVSIYNGASLVSGTGSGNELRLTFPDYYTDTRQEDNAIGSATTIAPSLSSGAVSYGAAVTVRYYVVNGAVVRNEANAIRKISNAAGAFVLTFKKETVDDIRCHLSYDQPLRGNGDRRLRREVAILCNQRVQLKL